MSTLSRRNFMKSLFATAVASTLLPSAAFIEEFIPAQVYVNYRELAKDQLAKWFQEQEDQMILEYLTGTKAGI